MVGFLVPLVLGVLMIGPIAPVVDDGNAVVRLQGLVGQTLGDVVEHQGRGILDDGSVWLELTWVTTNDLGNVMEVQVQPHYAEGETGAGRVEIRALCEDEDSGVLTTNGAVTVHEWNTEDAVYGPPAQEFIVTGLCGLGERRVLGVVGNFVPQGHVWALPGIPADYSPGWVDGQTVWEYTNGEDVQTLILSAPAWGGTGDIILRHTKLDSISGGTSSVYVKLYGKTSGTKLGASLAGCVAGRFGSPCSSLTYTETLNTNGLVGGLGYLEMAISGGYLTQWYPVGKPGYEDEGVGATTVGAVVLEDWVEGFVYNPEGSIQVEAIGGMCQSFAECMDRCTIDWDWNVARTLVSIVGCLTVPTIDFSNVAAHIPDLSETFRDARVVGSNLAYAGFEVFRSGSCGSIGGVDLGPTVGGSAPLTLDTCAIYNAGGEWLTIFRWVMVGLVTWGMIGWIFAALGFAMRWQKLEGPMRIFPEKEPPSKGYFG